MRIPLFVVAALLAGTAHADKAAEPPLPPPSDAPASCTAPVTGTDLSASLAAGPTKLSTHTLKLGTPLTTKRLRLHAYGQFVPTRVGATTGYTDMRFEAEMLAPAERLPILSDNSNVGWAPGNARVGTYRVTTHVKSAKKETFTATVERLGCAYHATHAPLTQGESLTVWMSTDGVQEYNFTTKHWFEAPPELFITFNSELDPTVQQDNLKAPHGYTSLRAGNGSMSPDDSHMLNNDALAAGVTFTLHGYTVEVLRVVLGKDTEQRDNRLYTKGEQPTAHVLLRVTK
jgi:hypothetical protein